MNRHVTSAARPKKTSQKTPENPVVIPVILSGGAGTRLWPLSRPSYPKQFLELGGQKTLLQETALRFQSQKGKGAAKPGKAGRRIYDPVPYNPPLIVCNASHRSLIEDQLKDVKVQPSALVVEPVARGTAAAMAAAAAFVAKTNPEALLFFVASDHIIENSEAFHNAVRKGIAAAENGALVVFGAKALEPSTGFGYILRGSPDRKAPGCYGVKKFLEKPTLKTAIRFVESGDYFWNCSLFLGRASVFLTEMEKFRPDILKASRLAVSKAAGRGSAILLNEAEFRRAHSESFDKAVMEHTDNVAMVPVEMGWSDIGSWSTVWQVSPKDPGGNAGHGNSEFVESHNCYVYSKAQKVVTLGVEDIVVVVTDDSILVMPRDRAQDVRQVAR